MKMAQRIAALRYFNVALRSVNRKNISEISNRAAEKLRSIGLAKPLIAIQSWEHIKLMAALLRDYTRGAYREVPWKTLSAISAAVIYFVTPFDAAPDVIPFAGYLDDAFIANLVFTAVEGELKRYAEWKTQRQGNPPQDRDGMALAQLN